MTPDEYREQLAAALEQLANHQKAKRQAGSRGKSTRTGPPPGAAAKGGANTAPILRRLADEHYAPLYALLAELRAQGLSLRAIAAELNARGEKTRDLGRPWNAVQVARVLRRGERIQSEKDARGG